MELSDLMTEVNQLAFAPITGSQVSIVLCMEALVQMDWALFSKGAFELLVSVLATRIIVWEQPKVESSISVVQKIMEHDLFKESDAKKLIFAVMSAMTKLDTTTSLTGHSLFILLGDVLHALFSFCSFDKGDYAIVQEMSLGAYKSADLNKRRFLTVAYSALIHSKTDDEIIDRHAIPFLMKTLDAYNELEIRSDFVLVIAHGLLKRPVTVQLNVLWCEIMQLWNGPSFVDEKRLRVAVTIIFDMLNDNVRLLQLIAEKERLISNFLVDALRYARKFGCLEAVSGPCTQHLIAYISVNIPILIRISHHIRDKEVRHQALKLLHALCRCPFELVRVVMARQFPEACKMIFESHGLHWAVRYRPIRCSPSCDRSDILMPSVMRRFGIVVPSSQPRPVQKEAKQFLLSILSMLEDDSQEVRLAMMNGLNEARNVLSACTRERLTEYKIAKACYRMRGGKAPPRWIDYEAASVPGACKSDAESIYSGKR